MTWADFVVTVVHCESIDYKRMFLQDGTAEGLVDVSKSKIPVQLENKNVWQPSGDAQGCYFYRYKRAFPWTCGNSIQQL